MKTKIILIILLSLFVFISFNIKVEAVEFKKETKYYIGEGAKEFNDIIKTMDGGYLIVGEVYQKQDENDSDAMIIKYDKNGNKEWQNSYGGSSLDIFTSVIQSNDGGYVATGYVFSGDIIGVETTGTPDGIIVKYDCNGNIEWQNSYGGSDYDYFTSVIQAKDNGFVVVGTIDSDDIESIKNNGFQDGIIVKYDCNGNKEWQKSYGGNGYDKFNSVVQTIEGKYIVAGNLDSTDLDGIELKGYEDALLVMYDEEGNIEWQKNYNEGLYKGFDKIIPSKDGKYLAVGYMYTASRDSISTLMKCDEKGNLIWENKEIVNNDIDSYFFNISEIEDGYIILGKIGGTPIPMSLNDENNNKEYDNGSFMFKCDKNCKEIVSYNITNQENEFVRSIIQKDDGEYIAVGTSYYYEEGDSAFITRITENYTVSIGEIVNGNVDVALEASFKSTVKLNITPNDEYILKDIIIRDSKGNVIPVDMENHTFIMPADDVTVNAVFELEEYEFSTPENQKYIKDESKNGLEFRCTGKLENLSKVLLNDNELSKENYTLENGSTIITLKDEFLNTLENGKYELKLIYTAGQEVTTNFTIENKKNEEVKDENEEEKNNGKVEEDKTEETNKTEVSVNVKTGDNIIVFVASLIISVFGMIVINKKRKNIQ